MSSNSYTDTCPCCNKNGADYYSENKPFEMLIISCPNCGFYTYPSVGRMTVEDTITQLQEYSRNELNEELSESEIKKAIRFYKEQGKNFEEFSEYMNKE